MDRSVASVDVRSRRPGIQVGLAHFEKRTGFDHYVHALWNQEIGTVRQGVAERVETDQIRPIVVVRIDVLIQSAVGQQMHNVGSRQQGRRTAHIQVIDPADFDSSADDRNTHRRQQPTLQAGAIDRVDHGRNNIGRRGRSADIDRIRARSSEPERRQVCTVIDGKGFAVDNRICRIQWNDNSGPGLFQGVADRIVRIGQ